MRTSRTTQSIRIALGLAASLFLLAPSAAFAQYLKYEATGHLKQFNDVLDAGTTADLAAAGIVPGAAGVGTPVTTTTIVLAAEPDGDADPTVGLYETIFMSMDIGDGTMKADRFQRDANVNVAIGFLDTEVFPLALDLFGWTGSEPARQTMPAGFAYNGTAPSAPGAGDGKGHAVGAAALSPSAALPNDALPTSIAITDFALVPMYLDILDLSRQTVPGTQDSVQLEFAITSLSVTNIPTPIEVMTGPLGIGLLASAMIGGGLLSLRMSRRRSTTAS